MNFSIMPFMCSTSEEIPCRLRAMGCLRVRHLKLVASDECVNEGLLSTRPLYSP